MKYKVGDIVKIIKNDDIDFRIGEIATIDEIEEDSIYCIHCENENNEGWVSENDITPLDYTWEDFLKAPIGTKVTFERGEILVKTDYEDDPFANEKYVRNYENLKDFKDNIGSLGKIIKIGEPTYTTVYESKEDKETMPEIEEMKRLTDELCKTCDEFIKKMKESK